MSNRLKMSNWENYSRLSHSDHMDLFTPVWLFLRVFILIFTICYRAQWRGDLLNSIWSDREIDDPDITPDIKICEYQLPFNHGQILSVYQIKRQDGVFCNIVHSVRACTRGIHANMSLLIPIDLLLPKKNKQRATGHHRVDIYELVIF